MDVLARALIEAKLKIAGEHLVLRHVASRRQNAVATMVGKLETNNVAGDRPAVVPTCASGGIGRSTADESVVGDPARRRIFLGRSDDRLRQSSRNRLLG